jgi:hypothetical protein
MKNLVYTLIFGLAFDSETGKLTVCVFGFKN